MLGSMPGLQALSFVENGKPRQKFRPEVGCTSEGLCLVGGYAYSWGALGSWEIWGVWFQRKLWKLRVGGLRNSKLSGFEFAQSWLKLRDHFLLF